MSAHSRTHKHTYHTSSSTYSHQFGEVRVFYCLAACVRESGDRCGVLCTFVPFRFDAFSKTERKKHTNEMFSIQHCYITFSLVLSVVSCRTGSCAYMPGPLCIRWYTAYKHIFSIVLRASFFHQFLSHFHDYIHTMECLLSACAQVAIFSAPFMIRFCFILRT